MSSIARRPSLAYGPAPERTTLDRLLACRPRVTWEALALGGIFLVGVALRFWALGDRAIHHDESLHATYSYYLFKGQGYTHDPLMHGPFLFHAMAFTYLLFGATDATARFVPAILGSLVVVLPWLLRGYLGRAGTIAASLLLALSPTMLYFSRFVGAGAQDIVLAVTALLLVAATWRYMKDGRSRWLYLAAGALSISFATKEVTFMVAVVFIVWLNGLAAYELACQREQRARPRYLWTVALMPITWLLAAFWPALVPLRKALGLQSLPRSAGMLLVLGLFTAPQFAAGIQVLLERFGMDMAGRSSVGDLTNEALYGAITVGVLITATTLLGLAWRRRDFLICAAIFWGIYIVLFTTFFTNMRGFATGIWGSLDYWLEQQGEERGKQPVYYYTVLTPVYEYLTLLLASAGIALAAWRGGRTTLAAFVAGIAVLVAGVWFGDGAHLSIPFGVAALLALVLALRKDLFRSFLAFWAGAIFFGLSASGEKMPWLEVHIALPLALLAALTVKDAFAGVRARGAKAESPNGVAHPPSRLRRWQPALAVAAVLLAMAASAALVLPGWRDRQVLIVALMALAGLAWLAAAFRSRAIAGLAGVLALAAFLGPLSVRDAVRATFIYGDTPRDMLIYTQTSPQFLEMVRRVDQLSKDTGMGKSMPITIDVSDAFTWPWAWYLRDYRNVRYLDLSLYTFNENLASQITPSVVLFAQASNMQAAGSWPDVYGPGERIPHRWWFPEEAYREATAPKLWDWLREPSTWANWRDFLLDRTTNDQIGSVDTVAFFPVDPTPARNANVAPSLQPRIEENRLVVGGSGNGAGAFNHPAGVAVDRQGNVYVADSANSRIQKFSPSGEWLDGAGGRGLFNEPWGIAVDDDGNVYVADTWNHRIHKLNSDLKPLLVWGVPATQPSSGAPGPYELYGPRDVAVDREGDVWVTDTGNNRLIKYSPEGVVLGVYGSAGKGPGQFREPVGIAFAPNGNLLVADTWNGRVQELTPGFRYVDEFHVDGWDSDNQVNKPYLAALPDGTIMVSVPDLGRLYLYAPNGRRITAIDRIGVGGSETRPLGLTLAPDGWLWVADAGSAQLVRLSPP